MSDPTLRWKEYCNKKIIHPDQLLDKVNELKGRGLKIATLNGSFDLLHAGHMFMIYEASCVADVLLILLNSDTSVKAYKSPKRPIIPLDYRIEIIAALDFVDYVSWFDETDPCAVLSRIKPDVHVNGVEYGENCIESEIVKQGGGKLHLVPRIEGLATSHIIEKIKQDC